MFKHTPGPWKIEPSKDSALGCHWWVSSTANFRGADEYGASYYLMMSGICRRNDAALMAAAPDLLKALEEISDCYLGDCPTAMDEKTHAVQHVSRLRKIAYDAMSKLMGDTAAPPVSGTSKDDDTASVGGGESPTQSPCPAANAVEAVS